MTKLTNMLEEFYSKYDEDNRLSRSNTHKLEYITTTRYIDKYLTKNSRILEVGAGTGKYSLHYASLGYRVDSVELTNANLEILKSKIKDNMNITAVSGNALDLSMYDDNTFDVTLVLGPLYHLFSEKDKSKAISEAIRVTKKDGIILLAFILFDHAVQRFAFVDGELKEVLGKQINTDYTPNNQEKYIFSFMYIKDIKKLIKEFDVEELTYVATDGITRIIEETIDNMDDEMFEHYIDYHLSTCEREDLIGYSSHILSIIKKK